VSLILDALRKADAQRERERGAVPGLHAQPVTVPSSESPAPAGQRPGLWIALAAGLLAAAAAAWLVAGRQTLQPSAAPTPAQAPVVVAPPKSVETVTPVAAAPAPPVAVAPTPTPPAPPQPAPAAAPQPVAEPAPWPSTDRSRLPAAEAAAPPAAAAPAKAAAPPPSAAVTEPAVLSRQQLPEAIRAQLPPLAVGGSIYSPSPADRSVIIDGRIYRENDRLGADLTLEQIGTKSAVLRYKGYRFEIGF
jgi:general secretion pathway protein B